MAKVKFHVVNAFGKHLFEGNPAAVIPNADDIDDQTMQSIARQLNLIETVFISQSNKAEVDYRFRYFTPTEELPIAGHPSIAAWLTLTMTNEINIEERSIFYQENGAGIQEIKIYKSYDDIYVTMKQPQAKFKQIVSDLSLVANVLGVSQEEFDHNLPIQCVDTGLGHLVVPMRSLDSLMKVKRNINSLSKLCQDYEAREVQAFSFETYDPNFNLHTRNICPRHGIEDPACGVGNAALSCYLHANYYRDLTKLNLKNEQGFIIDMPSIVTASVEKTIDGNYQAYTGGLGVKMIVGELSI